MTWEIEGRTVRRVLVTRLRYLGDIVMSTGLLTALKTGDPDIEVRYLCETDHADVLEGHPDVDHLDRLATRRRGSDARARIQQMAPDSGARRYWSTVTELRKAKVDLAVDLFFNPRSAWLLRLAGIPFRLGGTRKLRGCLYTHNTVKEELTPEEADALSVSAPGGIGDHLCRLRPLVHRPTGLAFLEWQHRNAPAEGWCPNLGIPPTDGSADSALQEVGISPETGYFLLAPGATWRDKEWPVERWAELVEILARRWGTPLAVMVPPGMDTRWQELSNVLGRSQGGILPALPLTEALTVVRRAKAMISVDGGMMHASVGYGNPTVGLFGPTIPEIWYPYTNMGPFRVVAPEDGPALAGLRAEAVAEALETLHPPSG